MRHALHRVAQLLERRVLLLGQCRLEWRVLRGGDTHELQRDVREHDDEHEQLRRLRDHVQCAGECDGELYERRMRLHLQQRVCALGRHLLPDRSDQLRRRVREPVHERVELRNVRARVFGAVERNRDVQRRRVRLHLQHGLRGVERHLLPDGDDELRRRVREHVDESELLRQLQYSVLVDRER